MKHKQGKKTVDPRSTGRIEDHVNGQQGKKTMGGTSRERTG